MRWWTGFGGRATRLVVTAVATGTLGCGPVADGDCLTRGIAELGRSGASSRTVTCALPAERWVVALPANARLDATSGVPNVYWPGLEESAKDGGSNFCEVSETALFTHAEETPATRPNGTILCRRVPFDVPAVRVARARTFAARIEMTPTGRVVLKHLDTVTR